MVTNIDDFGGITTRLVRGRRLPVLRDRDVTRSVREWLLFAETRLCRHGRGRRMNRTSRMFRRVPCRILIAAHRRGRFLTANTIATISQALLDRATTPRSDSPVSQCADDRYRREDIGEHPGPALDQPLERHALMEIYSVLHDEVLVAGMKNLWIDRGTTSTAKLSAPTTQTSRLENQRAHSRPMPGAPS